MLVMLAFAEAFPTSHFLTAPKRLSFRPKHRGFIAIRSGKNPVAAARGEAASAFTLLVFSTPTFRCKAFVCEILANSLIVG